MTAARLLLVTANIAGVIYFWYQGWQLRAERRRLPLELHVHGTVDPEQVRDAIAALVTGAVGNSR